MIIVISGPSGAGKSRLAAVACGQPGFDRVVPYTTRQRRPTEQPGLDYTFVSVSEFHRLLRDDQLAAWDYTIGNYYGLGRELGAFDVPTPHTAVIMVARLAIRFCREHAFSRSVFVDGPDELLSSRVHDRADLELRRLHRNEERIHAPLFDTRVSQLEDSAVLPLLQRLATPT